MLPMITDHYELENHLEMIRFNSNDVFLLGVRSGVLNNGKSHPFSLLRVAVVILCFF